MSKVDKGFAGNGGVKVRKHKARYRKRSLTAWGDRETEGNRWGPGGHDGPV